MKSWTIAIVTLAAPLGAQQVDPDGTTYEQIPTCVNAVQDQATGNCVGVSSVPTMGMLYPLNPDFYYDSTGNLQIGTSVVVDPTVAASIVQAFDLFYTNGLIGIGTTTPAADLHVRRSGSAQILLEADLINTDEFAQPRVTFSQDGGTVQAFAGFQDGLNDFTIRNLYSAGGLRFDIHTSSTRSWEFRRRATTATDVEARITRPGDLELDGTVSSPAADLAEFYPVRGTVEPGDVVAFTGDGLSLERARSGVQGRLAGVISSRPAFTMGLSYTVEDEPGVRPAPLAGDERFLGADGLRVDRAVLHEIGVNRRAPLALSGRVPCKVTAENGPIRAGDLLTVSSKPGRATRATEAGPVVGTALEPWDAGEGTILVLANLGWFSPTQDLERRVAELESQVRELLASR